MSGCCNRFLAGVVDARDTFIDIAGQSSQYFSASRTAHVVARSSTSAAGFDSSISSLLYRISWSSHCCVCVVALRRLRLQSIDFGDLLNQHVGQPFV